VRRCEGQTTANVNPDPIFAAWVLMLIWLNHQQNKSPGDDYKRVTGSIEIDEFSIRSVARVGVVNVCALDYGYAPDINE
jgi:hypothetical protein